NGRGAHSEAPGLLHSPAIEPEFRRAEPRRELSPQGRQERGQGALLEVMAPSAHSRVLRVGVVQSGRVVEERHLRPHARVTVGRDARNNVVIANAHVPGSIPLFEHSDNRYQLLFSEGMQGRVRLGGADVDFASLMQQGLAEKRGNLYVLPLPESAKG